MPEIIKLPVSRAFRKRVRAVRAFRHACAEAYRRTGDDIYISNMWVLPWYFGC
jgi:hypothetical protein